MEGERKRPRDDGNGHEHIELPKAKRPRVEPIPGMHITLLGNTL